MKTVNKVTLLGAVGKDPDIRYTAQGMAIASFSLATSKKRKDKEEVTQWHNCVAFGKLAEIVQQYIVKGSKLYLEGEIDYQVVEKEGSKTYYTKIVVNELSMLSQSQGGEQKAAAKANPASSDPAYEEFQDSEIPF